MKAMQDKVIAIITNMVLALALIVVAGTMSSDVTGYNEGESNQFEENSNVIADVDASIVGVDVTFVGVPVEDDESGDTDAENNKTEYTDESNVCDADNIVHTLIDKYEYAYENMFLVNVSDSLNVRAEANADSEIVGKLKAGQGGKILYNNGEWSLIRSGNILGYIKNAYVWFEEEAEAKVSEKGQLFGEVTATKLRVRAKATTASTTLGMVITGERLEIVKYGEEWTQVIFENATGFVATRYIKQVRAIGTGLTVLEQQERDEAEAKRIAELKAEEERKKEAERKKLEAAIEASGIAKIVQTSALSLTPEDAYLIACCVSAEVGSSSYECQLAVANIILNRYKAGYGKTVRDVIYAKNAFSVTRNGSMQKYINNGPKAMAVKATADALAGNNNMVGFYHFIYLPSANFDKYYEYIIIGTEVFYKRHW